MGAERALVDGWLADWLAWWLAGWVTGLLEGGVMEVAWRKKEG